MPDDEDEISEKAAKEMKAAESLRFNNWTRLRTKSLSLATAKATAMAQSTPVLVKPNPALTDRMLRAFAHSNTKETLKNLKMTTPG